MVKDPYSKPDSQSKEENGSPSQDSSSRMIAWDQFVEAQESELGAETVNKWLKSLKVIRYDAANIYLEAKDTFQAIWFDEHIKAKAQKSLVNNNKRKIKVHLSVLNVPAKAKLKKDKSKQEIDVKRPAFVLSFDDIDPYCTFETLVETKANEISCKVLRQVAFNSNEAGLDPQSIASLGTFNPIYIHGGVGSGKSHLLMAITKVLRAKGLRVIYSGAHTFTDHVVSAIRAGEMSIFRQSYRNIDVLIVDDVHVFSRKAATQEEFFHTFNTLHMAGKQIILSANCAPSELKLIEPRLVSRFEWGIVLPLEMPSKEEALDILKSKAEAMHFPLHEKVLSFLSDSFSTTKGLTKALEALILRSHLNQSSAKSNHQPLTVAASQVLLHDLLEEEKQLALTPLRVIEGVAEHFGIRSDDVTGKAQTRDCVLPRQIAMYFCRMQLKLPFVKIGEIFSKDHSTVMSSVKLIQKGLETEDHEISIPVRSILKKILSHPQ